MKILVVDDEWAICELLRFELQHSGFEVSIAQDEEEFRLQAFQDKPDLIILDIMLGEKNGVEIYEGFIHEGLDPKIPVIFLSALLTGHPEEPASPGRRYALYGKPFDPERLLDGIQQLVQTG